MTLHIVRREIPNPSGRLKAGDVYDTSDWRNVEKLVSTGYLAPYIEADHPEVNVTVHRVGIPDPVKRGPGRRSGPAIKTFGAKGAASLWDPSRPHRPDCLCSRCKSQRKRDGIPEPRRKAKTKKRTRSVA